MPHRIERKSKISRRGSHDLILAMAKYGDHSHKNINFRTDADVKRYYEYNGIDFDTLVEECRSATSIVTFFENLIGATWYVESSGEGVVKSEVISSDGAVVAKVEGPGVLTGSTYQGQFETALKALRRAIEQSDYGELLNAIVAGITSIESYINYRVGIWNNENSTDLLIDGKGSKVAFDTKIDDWIPKMTGGKKLDKGTRIWADYKTLRSIRDDVMIHAKSSAYGASYQEMVELVNKNRTGIAGMLFELHKLFDEHVPSKIIREMFTRCRNSVSGVVPASMSLSILESQRHPNFQVSLILYMVGVYIS